MWTAAEAKALMLASPEDADESDMLTQLTKVFGRKPGESDKSSSSIMTWVGVAAGVAGIAALVTKLLDLKIDFHVPSLADIKTNLGLGPKPDTDSSVPAQSTAALAVKGPNVTTQQELDSLQVTAPSQPVLDIIGNAASLVGVDKSLLLAIAHQESRFNVNARAKTSSAQGLFQLVSGTWRDLVKRYGKQYNITIQDIKVPEKNAILGACYVRDLMVSLGKTLGKAPSVTDVYAGFFLGASGARVLLDSLQTSPQAIAATLMPNAAKSNKNIFYTKDGTAKTVAEVYGTLYGKVGKQYLKFAQQSGNTATMAAADTNVYLPSPDSQSSTTQVASVSLPSSASASTVAANTTPVAMPFSAPDKAPVQVAMADTSAPVSSSAAVGVLPKGSTKQPGDYYKTADGKVIAMTG